MDLVLFAAAAASLFLLDFHGWFIYFHFQRNSFQWNYAAILFLFIQFIVAVVIVKLIFEF